MRRALPRWLSVTPAWLLLWTAIGAQGASGIVAGVVRDPNTTPVANIQVQLRTGQAGMVYKTTTGPNGTYKIAGLPPGTYDVAVGPLGYTFDRYEQKAAVTVTAGTAQFDVHLPWGGNLGTPGDDITPLIRQKQAPPGRAPRTRDGKPDFSGVWLGSRDPDRAEPSVTPAVKTVVEARLANSVKDHPSGQCLPADVVPLDSPNLRKIVQTATLIVRLTEGDLPQQIYLDGRPHPKDPDPTWLGHSIGRWAGNDLVVDTVGFNDRSWLDVYPHTEKMHATERWRRPDLGHLEMEFTVEDPGTFLTPWVVHNVWTLAVDDDLIEYVCENNKDAEKLRLP